MKSISYSNLSDIGINPLTGEACAYSMRVLCDLNEDGVALVAAFLGLPAFPKPAFAENWNSTVGYKPAVGSVMLTRTALPEIIRFALLQRGYKYVVGRDGDMNHTGFNDSDTEKNPAMSLYRDRTSCFFEGENPLRLWVNPSAGSDRNTHAFTGRTV